MTIDSKVDLTQRVCPVGLPPALLHVLCCLLGVGAHIPGQAPTSWAYHTGFSRFRYMGGFSVACTPWQCPEHPSPSTHREGSGRHALNLPKSSPQTAPSMSPGMASGTPSLFRIRNLFITGVLDPFSPLMVFVACSFPEQQGTRIST